MAKWGEGDPRWIVEDRPDATNVNNWHWTEKNADAWSKKKLKELLTDLKLEDATGYVTLNTVSQCEGEARANNRKAKLIFFYEWVIEVKWSGRSYPHADAGEVTGTLRIPNLSEEHTDMKDVDLEVSLTSSSNAAGLALKEYLRKGPGADAVRKQLQAYVDALKSEYSKDLILPKADSAKNATAGSVQAKEAFSKTTVASSSSALKSLDINSSPGVKIATDTIRLEEVFKCTGQEIYNALTQKSMMSIFTGSAVKMEQDQAEENLEFTLLDGNIEGKFQILKPFTKITQKWRLKSWPAGHYSEVIIVIKQASDETKLSLKQTQVPVSELDKTKQGWQRYYWEAIRRAFGFGGMTPY